MNREDVAKDLAVENNEVLRARPEQAEHYLSYFVDNEENHEENLAQRHMMHEEARQFLASQQGEQKFVLASYTKGGVSERDWPEDFQHENGQYMCRCHKCENTFIGYKRRVTCKVCANKYPEQAEGAQGERKRFEAEVLGLGLPVERDHHGAYVSDHVRHLWSGWELRAALAQLSPERVYKCPVCKDSGIMGHSDLCLACDGDWDARNAQPSPAPELNPLDLASNHVEQDLEMVAPELERPEVVGTLLIGEHYDGSKSVDATRSWYTEGLEIGAHHLMTVAQHDRIVGALRYKAELYDEVWQLVTSKGYMNVTTAISVLENERDAAKARVAELEKQEPVAVVCEVSMHHSGETDVIDKHLPCGTKLYAAPVAQAGQVPEGVRAWFEAKQAHVNAVDAYNARLKFVREHCPFGTSVDPEYQLMEEADRKARSLVGPMFDELRGLLAAAPAQGGE